MQATVNLQRTPIVLLCETEAGEATKCTACDGITGPDGSECSLCQLGLGTVLLLSSTTVLWALLTLTGSIQDLGFQPGPLELENDNLASSTSPSLPKTTSSSIRQYHLSYAACTLQHLNLLPLGLPFSLYSAPFLRAGFGGEYHCTRLRKYNLTSFLIMSANFGLAGAKRCVNILLCPPAVSGSTNVSLLAPSRRL